MARHRISLAKARLTGADRHNPQRFRDRAEPALSGRPLGDAPAYLSSRARAAWRGFAAELPWLVHEDRAALEAAATLRARIAESGAATPSALLTAYRGALGCLGATPTDRARVGARRIEEADPFSCFDG